MPEPDADESTDLSLTQNETAYEPMIDELIDHKESLIQNFDLKETVRLKSKKASAACRNGIGDKRLLLLMMKKAT